MTTLDKELERLIKDEKKMAMNQEALFYRTNLYPYEDVQTGEVFYSLRNYTFDELEVMNVYGGITPDAQRAQMWCEDLDEHINAALNAIGNDTRMSVHTLFAMTTKEIAGEKSHSILFNVPNLWESSAAPHVEKALDMLGGVNIDSLRDLARILKFFLRDPNEYSIVLEYSDALELRVLLGNASNNSNVEYLRELIELEIFRGF